MSKICTSCEAEMPTQAKFCSNCGEQLQEQSLFDFLKKHNDMEVAFIWDEVNETIHIQFKNPSGNVVFAESMPHIFLEGKDEEYKWIRGEIEIADYRVDHYGH